MPQATYLCALALAKYTTRETTIHASIKENNPFLQGRLITLNNLANAHRRLKHFDVAERMYREGIETARAAYGDAHPSALMFRLNLGSFLSDFRRYDEAKPMLTETYEQHRKTFGDEHQRTQDAKRKLTELQNARDMVKSCG